MLSRPVLRFINHKNTGGEFLHAVIQKSTSILGKEFGTLSLLFYPFCSDLVERTLSSKSGQLLVAQRLHDAIDLS